jgi:uncharacterized Ntn-hydrolase superfamily protein
MKRISSILLLGLLMTRISVLFAQDTFSIVAIDSVTGEIGSAGASCVGFTSTYPHGAQIISDVIPGIGAIHTQASWHPTNQQNAHNRMLAGDTPQQIVDWLVANDVQSNPLVRQYGVVTYNNGHPMAASYTGSNCYNYKNDTSHIYYSIQGNILLGQEVIDSIQSRFLNTPGPLAVRLMAALQGAKMVGADTRCASPYNASSQSSFIRVAKPWNTPGNFYLDLWMSYPQSWSGGAFPRDPIDSLQTLFNNWFVTSGFSENPANAITAQIHTDMAGNPVLILSGTTDFHGLAIEIYDAVGKFVCRQAVVNSRTILDLKNKSALGLYIYHVNRNGNQRLSTGKFIL